MKATHSPRTAGLIALAIFLCFVAIPGLAQSTDQDSCSKQPCSTVSSNQLVSADVAAANQQPDADEAIRQQTGFLNQNYTVSLNGGQPIGGKVERHFTLLYALSTSQGYETDVAGPFSNIDSYTSVYEGYLGGLWQFSRGYLVLQQDSAVTYFGSSLLQGSSFHRTAGLTTISLAPSLSLSLEGESSIGNNTLTELLPAHTVLVNGVPVIEPGGVGAGINLGFVWSTDAVATLNWKPDAHDIFSFRAENANRQFFDLNLQDNLQTYKVIYQRQVSQNTYLGAYGIGRHETGLISCESIGFGLVAGTRPTPRLSLSASAGPEYDSTGCFRHQGVELHFTGTYKTSPTSYLYALADRQLSIGFLPDGTWQDDIGGGFAKQITRRLWGSIGAGYERGVVVPTLATYHGTYEEVELRQRLNNAFSIEGLYRRLDQGIVGLGVHRNIFLVTLRWSPRNHDPGRTAMYQSSEDYRSGHEE